MTGNGLHTACKQIHTHAAHAYAITTYLTSCLDNATACTPNTGAHTFIGRKCQPRATCRVDEDGIDASAKSRGDND